MKKNAQLHLLIESSLLVRLKEEAIENSVSFAEYCRQKLRIGSYIEETKKLLNSIIKDGTK